jgi:hypothetical protein
VAGKNSAGLKLLSVPRGLGAQKDLSKWRSGPQEVFLLASASPVDHPLSDCGRVAQATTRVGHTGPRSKC